MLSKLKWVHSDLQANVRVWIETQKPGLKLNLGVSIPPKAEGLENYLENYQEMKIL